MAKTIRRGLIGLGDMQMTPGTFTRSKSTSGTHTLSPFPFVVVDAQGQYTTIQAAVDALSTNKGIVLVPREYGGANPTSVPENVTILDFRGDAVPATDDSSSGVQIDVNSTVEAAKSGLSVWHKRSSPSMTSSALLVTSKITGDISVGNHNGLTAELDVLGTLSVNPTSSIGAFNGETSIRSTGGTVGDAISVSGRVNLDRAASTTNVTNAIGIRGAAHTDSSTSGAIANAYGVKGDNQTVGTSRNYSFFSDGLMLFGFRTNNGCDFENTSGTPFNVLQNNGSDVMVYRPLGDGQGSKWQNRAKTATYLQVVPSNGATEVNRVRASLGTALVAGDFALSAGWGNTASVGSVSGTDQFCQFTITSAGTGQGASPTCILTFKDGTWTSAPIVQVNRQEFANQATMTFTVTTVTATAVTLTFNGTPVAAETYRLTLHVGGI